MWDRILYLAEWNPQLVSGEIRITWGSSGYFGMDGWVVVEGGEDGEGFVVYLGVQRTMQDRKQKDKQAATKRCLRVYYFYFAAEREG